MSEQETTTAVQEAAVPTPAAKPKRKATKKAVSAKSKAKAKPSKNGKGKGTERGHGLLSVAAKVLKRFSAPKTVAEIFEAVKKSGEWKPGKGKTPQATLAAGIYTEIGKKGKDSRFKQTERGLFAATGK